MNGIQIKSYLFPLNSKVALSSIQLVDEIRRFNLALNGGMGIYESLIQKLQASYGSLLPNRDEIKTYWVDDENELVGFSSDNEFNYAIDVQTAINMSKPYETISSNSLFKVYIARKPTESTSQTKPSEEKPMHFGVVCDGCEGPIVGIRFKCNTCPDYDLCETCANKNMHNEHTFRKIEKPQCTRSNFGGFFGHRHHGHHRHHGPRSCNRPSGYEPSYPSPPPNPFQHIFANIIPNIAANIPTVSNPEQLKNFGEYMKQFLDPFGIDVSYYVDNNEPTKEEKKEENKTEEPMKEAAQPTVNEETKTEIKRSESLMDESVNLSTPVITATIATPASEPTAPTADPLITISSESPYQEAASALHKALENYGLSAQNENKKQEEIKMDELSEDSGFNLIDIEKELRIIKAIEQLKSMGYRDDGGWLTRLVSAKDGNINQVLDAIAPTNLRN